MEKGRWETRVLGVLVYAAIAATIICCGFAPWFLRTYRFELAYIGPLYMIGAAFIFAAWQLRNILKNVTGGEPFIRRNVTYLKRIAGMCFIVAVSAILMLFIYFSFIKVLLAMLALAGGLTMRVLAWVFQLAVEQKEEMDLII